MINNKAIFTFVLCSFLTACSSTDQKGELQPSSNQDIEIPAQPVKEEIAEQTGGLTEQPYETVTIDDIAKDIEPEIELVPLVAVPETEPESEPEIVPIPEPEAELKPKPQSEKTLPVRTAEGKLILGSEEWVFIPGLKQNFVAKVDTRATTSSVSATDIVEFERDGKDWVKFKVHHGDITSREVSLPIIRWAIVKQSSNQKAQVCPVVSSWVQVGSFLEKTDFTLADRTHLSTPMLLGRSFFRDVAIIDANRKYVQPKTQL